MSAIKEQIYVGEKIPGIYIRKIASDGTETVKQGGFIRRASDNQVVYCLEPFILIKTEYYEGYENPDVLNVSKEVWDRITLIAYYGYQYKNHTADYWYYVTQMLIWRTVDPNSQFYFTNSLGGANDEKLFQDEINEINMLVDNHYVTPDIKEINLLWGESVLLVDNNNVLSDFQIVEGTTASIKDNSLLVTADSLENKKIVLKKINDRYNTLPIIYMADGSQSIMSAGYVSEVKQEIKINVQAARLKLQKIDAISKEPINIAGIKFLIYDAESLELISEGITNNEGVLETDYIFKMGKYKIVEEPTQIIPGYEISKEPIYFEVKDDLDVTVQFFNNPLLGGIKIIKVNENNVPLENCIFGLYNIDGSLIDILKTNSNGEALITGLREGKYLLKELKTVAGYLLDETVYEIELKLENKQMNIVEKKIINYQEKGSLEIIKVNKNNEALEGTEFELYDENREKITTVVTDSSGKIYIDNLKLGKYYLKETKASLGYKIIDDLIHVEIKNNKELITIKVTNDLIDIDIPDTQVEFKIDKYILKKKKISL